MERLCDHGTVTDAMLVSFGCNKYEVLHFRNAVAARRDAAAAASAVNAGHAHAQKEAVRSFLDDDDDLGKTVLAAPAVASVALAAAALPAASPRAAPPLPPAPAVPEPLPLGWTEHPDAASGRSYFSNSFTNETSWDRPALFAGASAPPLPPVTSAAPTRRLSIADKLTELTAILAAGAITQQDFEAAKRKILTGEWAGIGTDAEDASEI
jgi:hypothetical protein